MVVRQVLCECDTHPVQIGHGSLERVDSYSLVCMFRAVIDINRTILSDYYSDQVNFCRICVHAIHTYKEEVEGIVYTFVEPCVLHVCAMDVNECGCMYAYVLQEQGSTQKWWDALVGPIYTVLYL